MFRILSRQTGAVCFTAYGHAHHGKFRTFKGVLSRASKREKDRWLCNAHIYRFCRKHHPYYNVFNSDYLCKHWVCHMCLMCFLGVFSCVLTVGISPTKSMSTKNPKLGKTDLQLQRQFKGQVRMYFDFCTGKHHLYMNVIDSVYLCKHWVCHMCLICFGRFYSVF